MSYSVLGGKTNTNNTLDKPSNTCYNVVMDGGSEYSQPTLRSKRTTVVRYELTN